MKASCVLIPYQFSTAGLGIMNQGSGNLVQNKSDWELSLEQAIKRNKKIVDKMIIINRLMNFKQVNSILKKFGFLNFKQIIRSCPDDVVADIAFAAFEADTEEVLIVSEASDSILNDEEYSIVIKEAKDLAAFGNIVRVDFQSVSFTEKGSKQILDTDQTIYCFKAAVYLDELLRYDPAVYQTVKRAHFKKSNSFVNELLDEMIPRHSFDEAIINKSNLVKILKYKIKLKNKTSLNQNVFVKN
ncbi:mannose-1-phosphate guanylyltransferase [Cecembia calidifontis]|jgi:mannose-1-phosphate guanylyltransferase|uniref:Uncharacterized protein n=1 Tax=Cecembia calidifontis TaxID=1187080 RepID=A0A4Q7PAJ7_9BACT|nr:mannose-1-phosphate guanylyltransferase [Cecembia calidifontis]RZS96977.1 hypothetical protein BC751_2573 [Cecembia calidifontis]